MACEMLKVVKKAVIDERKNARNGTEGAEEECGGAHGAEAEQAEGREVLVPQQGS